MNNPNAYFSAIRETRAQLSKQFPDGSCLVISTIGPGRQGLAGRVTEVSTENAARLIVEGTHALASDTQAADYREAQAMARARCAPASSLVEARQQFRALMKERNNAA
jgi:hypothetical protein